MVFNDLEDIVGIKDLRELGGTATTSLTYYACIRIRPTDNGERIYYQWVNGDSLDDIGILDIEYFGPDEDVLDILNMDKDEFMENCDGLTPGFVLNGELYLIDEFIRDNY